MPLSGRSSPPSGSTTAHPPGSRSGSASCGSRTACPDSSRGSTRSSTSSAAADRRRRHGVRLPERQRRPRLRLDLGGLRRLDPGSDRTGDGTRRGVDAGRHDPGRDRGRERLRLGGQLPRGARRALQPGHVHGGADRHVQRREATDRDRSRGSGDLGREQREQHGVADRSRLSRASSRSRSARTRPRSRRTTTRSGSRTPTPAPSLASTPRRTRSSARSRSATPRRGSSSRTASSG